MKLLINTVASRRNSPLFSSLLSFFSCFTPSSSPLSFFFFIIFFLFALFTDCVFSFYIATSFRPKQPTNTHGQCGQCAQIFDCKRIKEKRVEWVSFFIEWKTTQYQRKGSLCPRVCCGRQITTPEAAAAATTARGPPEAAHIPLSSLLRLNNNQNATFTLQQRIHSLHPVPARLPAHAIKIWKRFLKWWWWRWKRWRKEKRRENGWKEEEEEDVDHLWAVGLFKCVLLLQQNHIPPQLTTGRREEKRTKQTTAVEWSEERARREKTLDVGTALYCTRGELPKWKYHHHHSTAFHNRIPSFVLSFFFVSISVLFFFINCYF